jgi:hypothetical protein
MVKPTQEMVDQVVAVVLATFLKLADRATHHRQVHRKETTAEMVKTVLDRQAAVVVALMRQVQTGREQWLETVEQVKQILILVHL